VIAEVAKLGYEPRPIHGKIQTVIAAIGDENTRQSLETLDSWPQVEHVHRVQKRYKLVSREVKKDREKDTIVKAHGQEIGEGKKFCFMAGPCSVESEEQLMSTAKAVKAQGATFLRGGAFKPRTSPYEFRAWPSPASSSWPRHRKEYGLGIVTEVLSERDVELVATYADVLQIGARNAQNFSLIIEAARSGKPILLKRA